VSAELWSAIIHPGVGVQDGCEGTARLAHRGGRANRDQPLRIEGTVGYGTAPPQHPPLVRLEAGSGEEWVTLVEGTLDPGGPVFAEATLPARAGPSGGLGF
jgi:hypothetical protein